LTGSAARALREVQAVGEEDADEQPGGGPRPRALVLTLYGLYAREDDGWLSVGTLIRLLDRLEVDEPAVRSSISRLKRRGLLDARHVDGAAGYALSVEGRALLGRGDRRIFDRTPAALADGWVLAVFSVPESERRLRHLIRSRLGLAGFGSVGPGVWIAPAALESEARQVLGPDDLARYVDFFQAHYRSEDLRHEVTTWWDLDAVDRRYRQFDAAHAPVLARWRRRRRDDDPAAFADYVRTVTAWRALPFLDPGLPAELLPDGWAGHRAATTFAALRERLEAPAHRFVDQVRDGTG
jgi:phenylacetic acid degradation operon negative regulatory protein